LAGAAGPGYALCMKPFQGLLAALAVLILSVGQAFAAPLERVTIQTTGGLRTFQVEVVDTPETRARGLMFRKSLPRGQGMLFDFKTEQPAGFWMENTYIPLDIIFIDTSGRIITIAENTTPLSLETIPSGGVARGVLEINGGLAKKLGIKVGDRVRHALFDEK
jgi:hypothetical protein